MEAAQVEIDPAKRRDQYARFQQIVQAELPKIPLVSVSQVYLSRGVQSYFVDAYGVMGNFSDAFLVSA